MPSEAVFPCVVQRAERHPAKCLITGDIDGPFIDTGIDIPDRQNASMRLRIYLNLSYVKHNIARDLLGLIDPEDAPESDQLAEYRERAEAAELALGLVQKAKVAV